MTVLSELLRQSNVQGWSNREISVRAEKNGHKLSRASVDVYMGGRHGRPTEPVLAAFSDVLNIPIDKLREAAGVPTGAGEPWAPPAEANRLDRRQRLALEELIRSMVTSETIGEDQHHEQHNSERSAASVDGGGLEDPAVADGVTAKPDTGGMRAWRKHREAVFRDRAGAPWDRDDVDLAAKHGRNRGAELRRQQDQAAEEGGA